MDAASLIEVFASVEGEGIHAGTPAVFLRFGGCNLACTYCDTAYARKGAETAAVYALGEVFRVANPLSPTDVTSLVAGKFPGMRSIVLTGGEPLLQAEPLREIACGLRSKGCVVSLETNGTLVEAFSGVRRLADFVCMDVKLPSSQGGKCLMYEHREFLKMLGGKDAAVKIVITPDSTDDEIRAALSMIGGVNRHLPVLLQPAFADSRPAVDCARLLEVLAMASSLMPDVRVSLQMHKILGVR